MKYLPQHIEALIFAAPTPVSLEELQNVLLDNFGVRFAQKVMLEFANEGLNAAIYWQGTFVSM
mgnify:CR=1 FL=1